jgi:hypothetical protein
MTQLSVVIEDMDLEEFVDMLTIASHCLNTGSGSLPVLSSRMFNAIVERNPTDPRAAVAKYIAEVVRSRAFEFDDDEPEDDYAHIDDQTPMLCASSNEDYQSDSVEDRIDEVYGHQHGRWAAAASWWNGGRGRNSDATQVGSLAELLKLTGKEKVK